MSGLGLKQRYEVNKERFFSDKKFNKDNLAIIRRFFEKKEVYLKRKYSLASLDEANYKTLISYFYRFNNLNNWLKNKSWKELTEKDIEKLYNDLEDGKITNAKGERFADRLGYYDILENPDIVGFEVAEKAKGIIIRGKNRPEDIRFFSEDTFKKIISVVIKPEHRLLCWLAWDYGENINSLLRLKKSDFMLQQNENTKEPEYRLVLRKEILKRTRTPRSELNNFPETAQLLGIILAKLKEEDNLFEFGKKSADSFLRRAIKITKAKLEENQNSISWKDFRSSMACFLLSKEWNTDEIKSRLGQKPSSRTLDKYISYLALKKHEPKRKIMQAGVQDLQKEIDDMKQREKLLTERIYKQDEKLSLFRAELPNLLKIIQEMKEETSNIKKKMLLLKGLRK